MTIEIHQPELQALIQRHMASGQFRSCDDLLLRLFAASPEIPELQEPPAAKSQKQNLTQFLKESPLWGSGLVIEP